MTKFKTDKDVTEDVIKVFEGFRGKAYLDKTGTGTIGYGHALKATDTELAKKTLSEPEALQLMREDIADHQKGAIKGLTKELNPNQMAALTSLAFNEGANGKGLTKIVGLINRGADNTEIAGVFNSVVKSKGQVLDVLVDRRRLEVDLFNTPMGATIDLSSYGAKKAVASSPRPAPVVEAVTLPVVEPVPVASAEVAKLPEETSQALPTEPHPQMLASSSPGKTSPEPSTGLISKLWTKLRTMIG
jgi:lysozyme